MYGNLRGVKESGKVFAVPTYFFMLNMGVLLVYGLVKYAGGDLQAGGIVMRRQFACLVNRQL